MWDSLTLAAITRAKAVENNARRLRIGALDESMPLEPVRGKARKKGVPKASAATTEVPRRTARRQGLPGLFACSPREPRLCLDKVSVLQN